jgi:hypothetical protein
VQHAGYQDPAGRHGANYAAANEAEQDGMPALAPGGPAASLPVVAPALLRWRGLDWRNLRRR